MTNANQAKNKQEVKTAEVNAWGLLTTHNSMVFVCSNFLHEPPQLGFCIKSFLLPVYVRSCLNLHAALLHFAPRG